MSKVIAFIPARGGSKSIPLKNIKRLHGQPLILWCIQELIECSFVDEIWVSTDADEIASVIRKVNNKKVNIFNRDSSFAQDQSSTEDAMFEFIKAKNLVEDTIMLVQATSPFTKAEHFINGLISFNNKNYDSILSVVESRRFFWDGIGIPVNYDFKNRPRRQDFEPYYLENGSFYINKASRIVESRNRLSGKIGYAIMPEFTSIEIDEELDWVIAEGLMKAYGYQPKIHNKAIKLVASDVDGVLTDAGMYYSESGDELKKFNTRDGKGFELLRNAGIKTAIITSENTRIVSNRAKKLKVDFLYQGKEHGGKLHALKEICRVENISMEEIAYIGDDINCFEALSEVGLAACPVNSSELVMNIPNIKILPLKGGEGVFRILSELILANDY